MLPDILGSRLCTPLQPSAASRAGGAGYSASAEPVPDVICSLAALSLATCAPRPSYSAVVEFQRYAATLGRDDSTPTHQRISMWWWSGRRLSPCQHECCRTGLTT